MSKIPKWSNRKQIGHECKKECFTCRENEDDELWLYGSEFETRINFCPFCGYEAKEKVEQDN